MSFPLPRLRRHRQPHLDRPAGPPNPFEALLLIGAAVQGVAVVAGAARPLAFTVLDAPLARRALGALFLLGGLAAVLGLFWRWHPVDGILIKRVGLIGAGGAALAYGFAAFTLGSTGVLAAVYNAAFAAACFVRVRQITVALAAFRKAHPEAGVGRFGGGRSRE